MCTAALFLCGGTVSGDAANILPKNPFEHQVQLGETVMAFPAALSTLEDAGWRTTAPPDEPFAPGQYARIIYTKEDACVTAMAANLGERRLALAECQLVGLASATGNGETVFLVGGFGLGAPREDILAVWGVPDGGRAAESEDVLRYTTGRNSYFEFVFEANRLSGVEVFNPSSEVNNVAMPVFADVLEYQPPVQLGSDWQSFTLEYAGGLYTLPAPVSAFVENGWHLLDEGALASGRWVLGVRLRRGNQILSTRLENFGDAEAAYAGSFVTKVESSRLGADVSMRLSGGASELSSREEIAALMGPPHALHESSNALTYTYRSGGGVVEFYFEPTAHTLLGIEVSCAVAAWQSGAL